MSRNLSTHPFDKNCVHRRTFEKNGQNFVKRQGISPFDKPGVLQLPRAQQLGSAVPKQRGGMLKKEGILYECTTAHGRDRTYDLCTVGDLQRPEQGEDGAGGTGPDQAGVPARPRPGAALQGLPPPQAENAGVSLAGRRSVPDPADPYAGGFADCPYHCPGPAAQRGSD